MGGGGAWQATAGSQAAPDLGNEEGGGAGAAHSSLACPQEAPAPCPEAPGREE